MVLSAWVFLFCGLDAAVFGLRSSSVLQPDSAVTAFATSDLDSLFDYVGAPMRRVGNAMDGLGLAQVGVLPQQAEWRLPPPPRTPVSALDRYLTRALGGTLPDLQRRGGKREGTTTRRHASHQAKVTDSVPNVDGPAAAPAASKTVGGLERFRFKEIIPAVTPEAASLASRSNTATLLPVPPPKLPSLPDPPPAAAALAAVGLPSQPPDDGSGAGSDNPDVKLLFPDPFKGFNVDAAAATDINGLPNPKGIKELLDGWQADAPTPLAAVPPIGFASDETPGLRNLPLKLPNSPLPLSNSLGRLPNSPLPLSNSMDSNAPLLSSSNSMGSMDQLLDSGPGLRNLVLKLPNSPLASSNSMDSTDKLLAALSPLPLDLDHSLGGPWDRLPAIDADLSYAPGPDPPDMRLDGSVRSVTVANAGLRQQRANALQVLGARGRQITIAQQLVDAGTVAVTSLQQTLDRWLTRQRQEGDRRVQEQQEKLAAVAEQLKQLQRLQKGDKKKVNLLNSQLRHNTQQSDLYLQQQTLAEATAAEKRQQGLVDKAKRHKQQLEEQVSKTLRSLGQTQALLTKREQSVQALDMGDHSADGMDEVTSNSELIYTRITPPPPPS